MLGQYDASRKPRLGQCCAISRRVSSLTQEQLHMSSFTSRGHEVAAARITASGSLLQEPISSSCIRGQSSTTCAMLLLFKDIVFKLWAPEKWINHHFWFYHRSQLSVGQTLRHIHLTCIRVTRHFVNSRWRNLSWTTDISWILFPSVESSIYNSLNIEQSGRPRKKASPICPLPNVKTSSFLKIMK